MREDKNNEKGFLKAYDDFSGALYRHCYFRIANRETVVDITQETFVKAWEYIALGKKVDNLKAFLYRVMNNLIIDYYRKRKNLSLDNLMESGFDVSGREADDIVFSAEIKQAEKMIKRLPLKDREMVVMHYIDDLTPKEIAEITGESLNSVSVRISRAMKKLRNLTNKESDNQ